MSLARRKKRVSTGVSAGGIPGLRNPIVAREIDKLEPSIDKSIELIRLRDNLGKTLAMIEIKSEDLLRLLKHIAEEFGKELPFVLFHSLFERVGASLILRGWLDGQLPDRVKIIVSNEGDEIRAEYIFEDWKIIGNVFSPDVTIQEVFDWFIHNRDVFEELVDDIGTSTGVYLDDLEIRKWLNENNIPLDDPRVQETLNLINELRSDVDRFNKLIEELRGLTGWKKEED